MTTSLMKVSLSPHSRAREDTPGIMLSVIFALFPAIGVSIVFYGPSLILRYAFGVVACVFFQWIFRRIRSVPVFINDYSAVLTGLLLVMCLPPFVPLWAVAAGAFAAIVLAKEVFGGLGMNVFNPALVGRTFLLISFPGVMTSWHKPAGFFADAISGATVLGSFKTALLIEGALPEVSFGGPGAFLVGGGGSAGEMSAAALLLGGIFLIYKKIISWHIPVVFIGGTFIFSGILRVFNGEAVLDPFAQILSGGLFLGAFFMATDYVTAPLFVKGKIIFALGCAILTVIIRVWGGYPEGVGFAILIMNAFTPLIDKYSKPAVFGSPSC